MPSKICPQCKAENWICAKECWHCGYTGYVAGNIINQEGGSSQGKGGKK